MKIIAIVPARSTSRRLEGKNFKRFFGKSIISWVLEEIEKSELFDKIVVSTDAKVKEYMCEGTKVQWLEDNFINNRVSIYQRKNPTYEQTVTEVCLEVLEEYPDYDYICCVYPTAYAITWQNLCESFSGMCKSGSVYSWSTEMLNGTRLSDDHYQRQTLDNGGFYWIKTTSIVRGEMLIGDNNFKLDVPMVDIDTMQDWAEAKLHALILPCGRFK